MQFALPTLGRIAAALVLAFVVQTPALACKCRAPKGDGGSFLHLNKESRITLPENALGVLYLKQQDHKIRTQDARGNQVLTEIPPKLKAKDFVIRDQTTGRVLKTKLTRIDVDVQLGDASRSYFLLRKGAIAPEEPALTDNAILLAEKHGLRDISAAVRDAAGLFRIAPAGGFIAGHSYAITAAIDDDDEAMDKAEVLIGPRLALSENDKFTLTPQGAPARELLDLAQDASCTIKRAAIVQQLRYAIPPQREPYRHLLATFTQQQFFGADLKRFRAPPKTFIDSDYRAHQCSEAPAFGASEAGAGKDLVYASCDKGEPERRQVRGFAGMLELEDTLHETPVLELRFGEATGPGCWRLRLVEDGGSAPSLRGWIGE
jgi:hypothetical protein